MAQRPIKIPPALEELLSPLADAVGAMFKKSLTAAADAALEDVEAKVDAFGDRIRRTRKKTRRDSIEPEAPSRIRGRR